MRCCSMLILGLTLVVASASVAQAVPGRYVTVWLLEVRYTPADTWHNAGKYQSYAAAQQSYVVRARHGGYTEMRIRQAVEWQPSIYESARINANNRYPLAR